ncbi:MAG: hypothetical protein RMM31_10625 [Anaerolineae bacterium]|nr:hypothetical protein [Anaerolineae bacterium]
MNPLCTLSLEELAYLWALHGEPHTAHLVLRADMGEDVLQKPLLAQRMTAAGHSLLARGLLEQTPARDGVQAIQPVRELFARMSSAALFFQYARAGTIGAVYQADDGTVVQERRYDVVYDFWVYPREEAMLRLVERLGLPAPQGDALPAPAARVTPALFERVLAQVESSPTDAVINLVAAGFDATSARALAQALGDPDARGEVALLSAPKNDAGIQLSGWRFVRGTEGLWWFPLGQPEQVLPAYQLTPAQSADLLATWFSQIEPILAQVSQLPSEEDSLQNVKQDEANSDKLEGVA